MFFYAFYMLKNENEWNVSRVPSLLICVYCGNTYYWLILIIILFVTSKECFWCYCKHRRMSWKKVCVKLKRRLRRRKVCRCKKINEMLKTYSKMSKNQYTFRFTKYLSAFLTFLTRFLSFEDCEDILIVCFHFIIKVFVSNQMRLRKYQNLLH